MKKLFVNALVFRAETRDFFEGALLAEDGVIRAVGEKIPADAADAVIDCEGKALIPGLIDVHTHGRAGYDFNYADADEMRLVAKSYLDSGVTTVMPTLASAPFADLCRSAAMIRDLKRESGGARFAGVHLEGRYLNPAKRGSHAPECLSAPDPDEADELIRHMGLPCHMTVAAEMDKDFAFVKKAVSLGATVGIGHTAATYDEAMASVKAGVSAFTHTFNAMPNMHHREGGAICASLTSDAYSEFICDGFHISPPMIRLAYAAKRHDRFVLISDSMAGAGAPDGEYMIGGLVAIVKDGKSLCPDGTIAGSTLSLFDGVTNLMSFCGISFGEAVACATVNPAGEIGLADRIGSLKPGCFADFLAVDTDGEKPVISRIYLGGEEITKGV